ncbi:MAG: cobalamin-dependent protein [Pseudomonadota bacterium]
MTKLTWPAESTDTSAKRAEVQLLAAQALAILAKQTAVTPPHLTERLVRLSDLVIALDPDIAHQAIDDVIREGLGIDDVIDHLLPEIARMLGERWFADDISFAEVSIGSARLQEMVRRLRMRRRAVNNVHGPDKRVLIIIPRPEEHTLGAFIAADQLRRADVSVEMSIAERRRELEARLRENRYHMVGITASGVRTLAAVKEIVGVIRSKCRTFTPIVLGGPLADADRALTDRLKVDVMTTDIRSAARRCGVLSARQEKDTEVG